MTKKNQNKANELTGTPVSSKEEQPTYSRVKDSKSRRRQKLGLTPEGVDRRFWSLWRAHVLAGIGLIAGYPTYFSVDAQGGSGEHNPADHR